MKNTSLLVLMLLAVNVCAAGPTSQDYLKRVFDVEGKSPYSKTEEGVLTFSALTSQFNSGNGHGYRNEVKIKQALRRPVRETTDHFVAIVTPTLPSGAKTIVAQYHMDGLGTSLKVYVQDTQTSGGFDGVDNNGVFDVLVRILATSGEEVMTPLAQIKSGESFVLKIDVVKGVATVAVESAGKGVQATPKTVIKDTGEKIYFKFGDYLQALDPATGKFSTSPKVWDVYFKSRGIDSSLIRFSDVHYSHE